jgi:hypothetical protein
MNEIEFIQDVDAEPMLRNRLFNAYFRRNGFNAPQPNGRIDIYKINDKEYAVLTNGFNHILAVYRIINITPNDFSLRSINIQWFKKITKKVMWWWE